jgi:Rho-binding antiterminator
MKEKYVPINCDFHDLLEELSTLKRACAIVYEDEAGREQFTHGHIVDLFSKDHEEFMRLNNDLVIRLDQVKRVNDQLNPT